MRRSLLLLPWLVATAGCANYTTAEHYGRGLVLILPGIEGRGFINQQIVDGLKNGGVPYALEVDDWTTGIPIIFIAHEMDYNRNREQGRRIAERLADYRRIYPGRPLWTIGQSGGGGVLVFALEELPDDVQVDGVFLLAPALSQGYNLSLALRHCRGRMYNYYSPGDAVFLGMGTGVFGTIDRKHESAAGKDGFRRPRYLNEEETCLYDARLVQVDCSKPGNAPGHSGLHLTSSSPEFVEKVIAPLILGGLATQPVPAPPGGVPGTGGPQPSPAGAVPAPGSVKLGPARSTPDATPWSSAAPAQSQPADR